MAKAAHARRAVVQRAGVFGGERDQIPHAMRLHRWVHHQYRRRRGNVDDRREITQHVIAELEQMRVHRPVADGADDQRVTIGLRTGGNLHRDIAAGARAIVHHQGLSEALRQTFVEQAHLYIGRAPRRERHQHADRTVGVSLCVCYTMHQANHSRKNQHQSACSVITTHQSTTHAAHDRPLREPLQPRQSR